MRNFILRRLLQTLPMLLLASFIIFMLFAKAPGDFIDGNITLTAARAAELKAIYGLDQPLLTRYLHWLGQLLRGDLGFSLQYQIPVSQLLNQYIWNSFLLASVALVFYWGIGLTVGVICYEGNHLILPGREGNKRESAGLLASPCLGI